MRRGGGEGYTEGTEVVRRPLRVRAVVKNRSLALAATQIRCHLGSRSSGFGAEAFAGVFFGRDVGGPTAVFEVPVDGFFDAGVEVFLGGPAELVADFGAVDGVAAVVAGAVGDVGDLRVVRFAVGARGAFVEDRADAVNDFEIRAFVEAADVVGFAGAAFGEGEPDGGGVVFDVEPVADLLAVAVDGEGFSFEGVENHQGDEFLGEVEGAVIVGAVGRDRGEAVGVLEGAD